MFVFLTLSKKKLLIQGTCLTYLTLCMYIAFCLGASLSKHHIGYFVRELIYILLYLCLLIVEILKSIYLNHLPLYG